MNKNLISLLFIFAAALAHAKDVLLVAHGGYTSCGSGALPPESMGLYPAFRQAANTLRNKGLTIHTLAACFEDVAPPDGDAKFVSSLKPGKLQYGDARMLRKEIELFQQNFPDLQVYLIGHSYGGWTAMYLAETLPQSVPVTGLVTLDPISPRCGPTQVIFGGADCHRAPRDLNNGKIKSRLSFWENFYQNQDGWLTSSSITEAKNHHMKYRGPHTEIDSDPRVWKTIEGELLRSAL